jgi:hypothetical protein
MSDGLATWSRAQSDSYSYGDGIVSNAMASGMGKQRKGTLMLTENELNAANLVFALKSK